MNAHAVALSLAALVSSSAVMAQTYSAQTYTIGGASAVLTGLNNQGQLVGYAKDVVTSNPLDTVQAFVTAPNGGAISYLTITDPLSTQPGSQQAATGRFNVRPVDIADNGLIVGNSQVTARTSAIIYSGGPYGTIYGSATAASSFTADTSLAVKQLYGPVVVDYAVFGGLVTAVSSDGNQMIRNDWTSSNQFYFTSLTSTAPSSRWLVTSATTVDPYLTSINNAGLATGSTQYDVQGLSGYAVLVGKNFAFTQAAVHSMGYSINNPGQIVGAARFADGEPVVPFITDPDDLTSMRSLGSLGGTEGAALDVNDLGQVVGYSTDAQGVSRAFLTGGNGTGMVDLNTLVSMPENEWLTKATEINDFGQIIAQSNTGVYYFLAVPEPSSQALMALGLMGIMGLVSIRRKATPPSHQHGPVAG